MSNLQNDPPPCTTCPSGYTYDPATGLCVQVVTTPAEFTGQLLEVIKAPSNDGYGWGGIKLYPGIDSATPLPLTGSCFGNIIPSCNTNWHVEDAVGTTITPDPAVQNSLWGTNQGGAPCESVQNGGGKLNKVGIWSNPSFPVGPELCFEFCVTIQNIEEERCIGIGGDNKVRIYIDGIEIVFLDAMDNSVGKPFNYWHVFPIALSQGEHIIKLCGTNIGAAAAFGAEIYNLSRAQLSTLFMDPINTSGFPADCGNVEGDLTPHIEWSSLDMVGKFIEDPNAPGEWSCDEGELSACDGTYECTSTIETYPIPCCYIIEDCFEVGIQYIVQLPEECAYPFLTIDEVYKFGLGPLPLDINSCYKVIGIIDPCQDFDMIACPTEDIGTCEACIPCYRCVDCENEENIIYFKWEPPPEEPLDLTKTYVFDFDPDTCWVCDEVSQPCTGPHTEDITKAICSGESFIIEDYQNEIAPVAGTYTFEYYTDPGYNLLFSESLTGWLPTGFPNGYYGPIVTLYVKVYSEDCEFPSTAILSLEWINPEECEPCPPPLLNEYNAGLLCDFDGDGLESINLTTYQTVMVDTSHPFYATFQYIWYYDAPLSIMVPDPANENAGIGIHQYHLRVFYIGCGKQMHQAQAILTVEILAQTDNRCLT